MFIPSKMIFYSWHKAAEKRRDKARLKMSLTYAWAAPL